MRRRMSNGRLWGYFAHRETDGRVLVTVTDAAVDRGFVVHLSLDAEERAWLRRQLEEPARRDRRADD